MVARKDVEMVRRPTLAVLALGAFFGHVVYPVTVGVASRLAPRAEKLPPPGEPPEVPYATAVVPAFQEAGIIGEVERPLAVALIEGGNFTCMPPVPKQDCAPQQFDVKEPALA